MMSISISPGDDSVKLSISQVDMYSHKLIMDNNDYITIEIPRKIMEKPWNFMLRVVWEPSYIYSGFC
jgi:hypothetical protein